MCLFYYCNFALGECKLYKGITNYIYNKYWGSTNYISNKYWGVQIPGVLIICYTGPRAVA